MTLAQGQTTRDSNIRDGSETGHLGTVGRVLPTSTRQGFQSRGAKQTPRVSGEGLPRRSVGPFPAESATPSVGSCLGSHCGARSGFTPTSSDILTASSPRGWTTRSAGGAGGAPAPRSGTRRGSPPGDVLGGS